MNIARRRFTDHREGHRFVVLAEDHHAVVHGHSIFPGRVAPSADPMRLLKSGHHSRKIGSHVARGDWRGLPIFTLTLEERATCPRSCEHWRDCYGNKMNWSVRISADAGLTDRLAGEIAELLSAYRDGIVIRLHVLGDFFSVEYVEWWLHMLGRHPQLHIFGYTAWQPDTPIGDAVARGHGSYWQRFRIRFSNGPRNRYCTVSIDDPAEAGDALVCPAQVGKSDCCGACALCWSTEQPIAFLRH